MLSGLTVLVIETEFIIALGLQDTLQAMGAERVVAARNPEEANQQFFDWRTAALAIVEIERERPELIEFARQLSQSGIAVIGLSADKRVSQGVPELPGTPILLKPLPDAELIEAVRGRLAQKP